jgi:hypothetical protein
MIKSPSYLEDVLEGPINCTPAEWSGLGKCRDRISRLAYLVWTECSLCEFMRNKKRK